MTVDIRRADLNDTDIVLELVEEYCASDDHVFDAQVARAGVEPLLAGDEHGVIWLALVDDLVDGYAVVAWGWSIEIGGLDVVLDEIYVRRRRNGVGRRLIGALETDCHRRGVKRIFMETELSNEPARSLYARLGYEADDSVWMSKVLV